MLSGTYLGNWCEFSSEILCSGSAALRTAPHKCCCSPLSTRDMPRTGQSHNPKYYDSIYIGATTLSLQPSNVWQIATSYQSQSISIFLYVCNTSVTPVRTVLPRPPHSPSPSFPPIPTDHEPYIVHSWHIKCPLSAVPYWLAFAELSELFLPYLSSSGNGVRIFE